MVAAAAHAVTPEKYYDYVQSTSDVYVDIDYTPKGSTVIEAEFTIERLGENSTIFCSRGADNRTFTLFYIGNDSNGKYFRWNAGTNVVGVLPSVDFAGNPRIYKEIIDIGCLEGIDEGLSIIVR